MSLIPGFVEAGLKLIDKIIPDQAQREQAKLALLEAENQAALQEMQTSLSAILAEANSNDPWTSRARPTFLYVMYFIILLCVIGGVIGIWFPGQVELASIGMNKLLTALPEELWWLFATGYLGYTVNRTYEKAKLPLKKK